MSELSEKEKEAFHMIRKRMSKCPAWCFCNTKQWKKVPYIPYVGEVAGSVKYREVRRFSLNPLCPLIAWLCPPGGSSARGGKEGEVKEKEVHPTTSLYMTTIENTNFCDVIHECEVVE